MVRGCGSKGKLGGWAIYSPHYVHLNSLLTKHWNLISDDPFLSTLFPSPPQVCYRRNPTLSSTLVKAALPGHPPPPGETTPINIKTIKSRTHKCTNPHCKAYPNALGKRILYSTASRTPYTFTESFTCMDTSLIYCILCTKCDKMYIGLTSQALGNVSTPTAMPPQGNYKSPCTATFHVGPMTSRETIE